MLQHEVASNASEGQDISAHVEASTNIADSNDSDWGEICGPTVLMEVTLAKTGESESTKHIIRCSIELYHSMVFDREITCQHH